MGELVIFENEMNKLQLGNLSKKSMDIFMALCFKMKNRGVKHIVMDFSEVKNLSGYKHNGDKDKNFIIDIESMTDPLLSVNSKIIAKKKDGKTVIYKFDLFPTFIINESTQTLEVGVNPDFQWLLNEFENYTSLDLEEIVAFKSKYTKNLYRLLRQWKSVGKLIVGNGGQEPSIEDFRKKIGVKDSYTTKEMLRSCIDVAVREINASDGSIKNLKYEKKYANRRGRPLTQIIFTWKKKGAKQKKVDDITAESVYFTVQDILKNNPEFKEDDLISIAKAAKNNGVSVLDVKRRITYVLKRDGVVNKTGYIIALMRKFNDAVEIRGVANSFNDFEHNNYDFDELERELLNETMEGLNESEEASEVAERGSRDTYNVIKNECPTVMPIKPIPVERYKKGAEGRRKSKKTAEKLSDFVNGENADHEKRGILIISDEISDDKKGADDISSSDPIFVGNDKAQEERISKYMNSILEMLKNKS